MPSEALPPSFTAARKISDALLRVDDTPDALRNLARAFIELDEKRQNTPPRDHPIERISLALERWAEGFGLVSVRLLDKGQRWALDERFDMRDVERLHVDLPAQVLGSCLVKTVRQCPNNWAAAQLLAYITKGGL